jgi:hypothetical protein
MPCFLNLCGAMVAVGCDDCEGDLRWKWKSVFSRCTRGPPFSVTATSLLIAGVLEERRRAT